MSYADAWFTRVFGFPEKPQRGRRKMHKRFEVSEEPATPAVRRCTPAPAILLTSRPPPGKKFGRRRSFPIAAGDGSAGSSGRSGRRISRSSSTGKTMARRRGGSGGGTSPISGGGGGGGGGRGSSGNSEAGKGVVGVGGAPRVFYVGPFECLSGVDVDARLAVLRAAARRDPCAPDLGRATFGNIENVDVRTLFQDPAAAGSVFQAASQVNCLEMAQPSVTPEDGVAIYARDRTQGPACALSCPAATVFRNYFVPVPRPRRGRRGSRGDKPTQAQVGQSRSLQLNLLAAAEVFLRDLAELHNCSDEEWWTIQNGYVFPKLTHEGRGRPSTNGFSRLQQLLFPSGTGDELGPPGSAMLRQAGVRQGLSDGGHSGGGSGGGGGGGGGGGAAAAVAAGGTVAVPAEMQWRERGEQKRSPLAAARARGGGGRAHRRSAAAREDGDADGGGEDDGDDDDDEDSIAEEGDHVLVFDDDTMTTFRRATVLAVRPAGAGGGGGTGAGTDADPDDLECEVEYTDGGPQIPRVVEELLVVRVEQKDLVLGRMKRGSGTARRAVGAGGSEAEDDDNAGRGSDEDSGGGEDGDIVAGSLVLVYPDAFSIDDSAARLAKVTHVYCRGVVIGATATAGDMPSATVGGDAMAPPRPPVAATSAGGGAGGWGQYLATVQYVDSTGPTDHEGVPLDRMALIPRQRPRSQRPAYEMFRRHVKVGVHWDTEVWLSGTGRGVAPRHGHRVCQVFCSALPVAYMRPQLQRDELVAPLARLMLNAMYYNTLGVAAALARARGRRVTAYLTAVGGGVFGNRTVWIADAVRSALAAFAAEPVDVVMVHYGARDRAFDGLLKQAADAAAKPSRRRREQPHALR